MRIIFGLTTFMKLPTFSMISHRISGDSGKSEERWCRLRVTVVMPIVVEIEIMLNRMYLPAKQGYCSRIVFVID